MRREDDRLVIEPVKRKGLLATLVTLSPVEEDFPDVDTGLLGLDTFGEDNVLRKQAA